MKSDLYLKSDKIIVIERDLDFIQDWAKMLEHGGKPILFLYNLKAILDKIK